MAGRWEITVHVRLSTRTEDITAVFEVEAVSDDRPTHRELGMPCKGFTPAGPSGLVGLL